MKITLRTLVQKTTLLTTAFILAVSTLTAAVPFILSQRADALASPSFSQGFETDVSGIIDQDVSGGTGYGDITRVSSGTNGISAKDGAYYATVTQDGSGPFTRFDGYKTVWTGDWKAAVDVYLDPSWTNGTGFDWSVAANTSANAHKRDFVFHVVKDTSTSSLIVAGSNNSSFSAQQNLESGNHYVVANAGWYTLQHTFRDNAGVLAVDLQLLDASGNVLFTETRSNAADLISQLGANRYGWFTYSTIPGSLAIDNLQLKVTPLPVKNVNTSETFSTIKQAINDSDTQNGDVIEVSDDLTVTEATNVNKDVTIRGIGAPVLSTSGANQLFTVTANGVTFEDLTITKSDNANQHFIGVQADNVTVADNHFSAQYTLAANTGTTRALVVSPGVDNLTVSGNTFNNIRQPAYIDNTATGTLSNNYANETRGWVIEKASNFELTGNSWGTNAVDFAIIPGTNPHLTVNNYTCRVAAIVAANNGANVEDQYPASILSCPNTAPTVTFEAPTPADGSMVRGTINGSVLATDDHGMGSYYIRYWKDAFESGISNLVGNCQSAPGAFLLGTTVNANCNYNTIGLIDGTKLVLSAQFLDGHSAWEMSKRTYTVDNTAPTLYIKQGASNVLPSSLPSSSFNTVSFKLFDAYKIDKVTINGVEKNLTDNNWSDVNGVTAGVFGAVEGANTIVVYDVAGNTTTYNFTIDTIAPVVTVTPVAGSLLSGTVTFDITVTDDNLNPSAPSTWVYLYNNLPPQASKGASINLSSGHGTFTVNTALLADGLATLNVGKLYDAAGNASGTTDTYFKNYTIDNTAPVITVNNLFTVDSTPVLTGHVDDVTATVVVKIGSTAYPVVVDANTGNWTAQVSPALSDGHYNVVATATDTAGNVGSDTTTNELTVDAHIPSAPLLLLPAPNGYSNSSNTLFTWLGPLFVWNGPASTQLQVATDSSFNTIVVDATGSASSVQFHNLADGVYFVRMKSTDALGGMSAWSSVRKFTVDTINPVVAITAPANSDIVSGTVTLTGTATDLNPSSYRWTILDSSNAIKYINTTIGDTVNPYNWDTTGVADGVYRIFLRATDDALNSVVTSVEVTVDNNGPTLAFTGTTPADGATVNGTVDVQGSFTDPYGLAWAKIGVIGHGWQCEVTTPVSGDTQSCAIDTTTLTDGDYQIALQGRDLAGNEVEINQTITVDNTAPVISFSAANYTTTGLPIIGGLVDDPTATLKLIVDGGTPIDITSILSGAWTHTFTSALAAGTYSLELVATDALGNSDFATATLVVTTPAAAPTTVAVTPTTGGTPSPAAQGVLGASTDDGSTDDATEEDEEAVEGAETVAAADTESDTSDGTIWGLAWYWWLLILAAIAGLIWWLTNALRNRASV